MSDITFPKHVEVVLQLKEPFRADPYAALSLLAQFVLENFGEGGNPDANQVEEFLGFVNTPVQGEGYVRVRVGYAYGQALEYIETECGGNEIAELVQVEWPGLGPGERTFIDDETGETVTEPDGSWPNIEWQETFTDEDGTVHTYTVGLGRIA